MYHYWGYGLHIASEIEFPELLPFEFDTPEVTIRLGKTPEALTGENVIQKVGLSMNPTEYLLKFFDTATYYAKNGNEITVEYAEKADEKDVRLFLLSNAMAAIIHQRSQIPLHASGTFYGDGVALFCGESGAGKSTLAMALHQKGYRIFTDDVCVLQPGVSDQRIQAVSSYPMMKLWQDSFTKLNVEATLGQPRIRESLPKYAHFYHENFHTAPVTIKTIFILNKSSQVTEPGLRKMNNVEAFKEVQKNSYRNLQVNGMRKRDTHFSMISELVSSSEVYKVTRPLAGDSLHQLVQLITSQLT